MPPGRPKAKNAPLGGSKPEARRGGIFSSLMGRCDEAGAGRRDPKRSPIGASIGIPQSGHRRLKNPRLIMT